MAIETVQLDKITANKKLQTRAGALCQEHVDDLAEAYEGRQDVDPMRVWVIKGRGGYWLTRGFHRLAALRKIKRASAKCEVKHGNFEDALLDAVQGNIGHGMRRTNRDKRQCVLAILELHPEWTDKKISEAAGVSAEMVGDVRKSDSDYEKPKRLKIPSIIRDFQKAIQSGVAKLPDKNSSAEWEESMVKLIRELAEEIRK